MGIVDAIGEKETPHEAASKTMFSKDEIDKLEQLKSKIDTKGVLDAINKDMFQDSTEIKTGGSSKVTQESVHIADGVKTITRKVIVNGMVVSTETIQEKDGVRLKHSEVIKEPIQRNSNAAESDEDNDEEFSNNVSEDDDVEFDKDEL